MPTSSEPSQEFVEPFVIAAHGNLTKVKELLAQNPALLNVPWTKVDETALQAASHMGRRDIAEYLLAHGAPLNIFTAAMLGLCARVAEFLQNDPSLANAKGVHGISLMYHAALSGQTEISELLLAHGGGDGVDSALHGAIRPGHREMVKWLLTHGADVKVLNFDQKTPLQVALDMGYTEIADLLCVHGGTE